MKRLILKIKGAFTVFIYALLYDSYAARFVYGAKLIGEYKSDTNRVKMHTDIKPRSDVSFFHNCVIKK